MAQTPPIIEDEILTYQRDGHPAQLVVDSPDWYAWLQTASTFTFRSEHGSFSAHKERAGNRRGRPYWRAYQTWKGKLQRAYLGQSEELTLDRLKAAAAVLSDPHAGTGVHATPEEGDGHAHRQQDGSGVIASLHRGTGRFSETAAHVELARGNNIYAPSYHLPAPVTALIGREHEQEAICTLLRYAAVRLVTLTGTGGVGKTRLALEVAWAVRADFADGVCFVELARVSDPTRVMAAIAQALGLWEAGDLPLEEQVHAYCSDRHMLLLLDNFEHVVEAAPQLASLLASCPHLSILVTSRTILHLSGEHQFAVPPLAVPDLTQLPETQALIQLAAVRLFVERARALQPAFQLTEANARTITEICARLDGLPLAIELAAARIKLLPPQALLKRLSRRLDVLTGGTRDLPMRQQTLRNTLQWSYDLLTEQQQRLFRWLAIFVGGSTLEATAAVCMTDKEQPMEVFDGVASLVDKSLVQQTEREGEEPRLVMLETIREFGLACLHRQGELEVARQAHAHYYLTLVEQAEPHLFGPEQPRWLDRLERDLDNLRVILQAATTGEEEEVQLALRLASALRLFWLGRGYLRAGRSVLEQLLASTVAVVAPVRLKALNALGAILWVQSDAHRLAQVADEALALARKQGDHLNLTVAQIVRGTAIMLGRRDYAAGQACLEKALTEARTLGDRLTLVWALTSLGRLAWYQQDAPRAIACLEEGLALCRAMGDKVLMSAVLILLAQAELSQGHAARGRALLEANLSIYQALGHTWGVAQVFSVLGRLAIQQGELSQAEAFLTDGARLASEAGDQRSLARTHLLLAGLAALRGDAAAAHLRYEEGLAVALDLGHTNYIASGLKGLGCVAAAQGLHTWAAVLWGAAEPLCESRSVAIPKDLYERMVAVVRSKLGEPAFKEARALGRSMTAAQALASREALPPQTLQALQPALAAPGSAPTGLTAREVEVLRLVAQGLSDAQVAEQLTVSPRTVNWHLTSIYSKLGVSSRSAATRFAIEHHLV